MGGGGGQDWAAGRSAVQAWEEMTGVAIAGTAVSLETLIRWRAASGGLLQKMRGLTSDRW